MRTLTLDQNDSFDKNELLFAFYWIAELIKPSDGDIEVKKERDPLAFCMYINSNRFDKFSSISFNADFTRFEL